MRIFPAGEAEGRFAVLAEDRFQSIGLAIELAGGSPGATVLNIPSSFSEYLDPLQLK
jgi:hypothetical protein